MKQQLTVMFVISLLPITTLLAQYEVYGAIGDKYNALRRTNPNLGVPISNEQATGDGVGRFQKFNGYDIYWHPSSGAHAIYGAIRDRYYAVGAEKTLGYPVIDVTSCDGISGRGQYVDFRRFKNRVPENASIYWSKRTGAFEVYGAIWARYKAIRGPKSCLGYPTSFEMQDGQGRIQQFENGRNMKWNARSGAKESCVMID
jgi:uncharacterized protein with LGFP repeats